MITFDEADRIRRKLDDIGCAVWLILFLLLFQTCR